MDNPPPNVGSKICKKHNQFVRYYDQVKNSLCGICILEKGQLIPVQQIQKQFQEIIINHYKENDLILQQLHTLIDSILKYKEIIIASLNKSIQQLIDYVKIIQLQQQSMQQFNTIMNQYRSIENFKTYLNDFQKSNRQFKNQILRNILLDFKQNIMKIDFLHSLLNQKQEISVQTELPRKVISDQKKTPQQIEYELIQQIKSENLIYDFAIDQRNNTLIVGMWGVIRIYDFSNERVGVEIQSLKAHTDDVASLYSMKNAHSFVSGSLDKSIIIWELDTVQKWKVQQILNCDTQSVYCIIMNSKEDLLISGSGLLESFQGSVRFWKKLPDSWNLSQTIETGNGVYALSLNENEDKLIVFIGYYQINIMNIQNSQDWKLIQSIKINESGYRLCFTIQDQFVFQPETSDFLTIYDFDKTKEKFQQKTKVQVKNVKSCSSLFPCQYIKKLDILTVKHGQFVNIFKVNSNGQYQLIQSIEYFHDQLYGKIADDGEYLITYDQGSQQIQVRKLKVKEGLS